jgi:hypothetical protein
MLVDIQNQKTKNVRLHPKTKKKKCLNKKDNQNYKKKKQIMPKILKKNKSFLKIYAHSID